MKKRVLITGGPTNEYIDEVMKITNMSSGKIAIELANHFVRSGYETTLLINRTIKHPLLNELWNKKNCAIMQFETTDELMNDIITLATMMQYDIIIHSAAVADYKPAYSFRMEDMADEIANYISSNSNNIHDSCDIDNIRNKVFEILTNPQCKVNDSTKISSCEPNLTVKLGLTPKIIEHLRRLFPDAYICGFKLLENVPEEELIAAAMKQIEKCNTDIVFANDLAKLRQGNKARLVISKSGYHNIKVDGAEGIFNLLQIAVDQSNNR